MHAATPTANSATKVVACFSAGGSAFAVRLLPGLASMAGTFAAMPAATSALA